MENAEHLFKLFIYCTKSLDFCLGLYPHVVMRVSRKYPFFIQTLYLRMLSSCPQPRLLVVAYRRSYDAIKDTGKNVAIAWKPDSTALAVTVSTEVYKFGM